MFKNLEWWHWLIFAGAGYYFMRKAGVVTPGASRASSPAPAPANSGSVFGGFSDTLSNLIAQLAAPAAVPGPTTVSPAPESVAPASSPLSPAPAVSFAEVSASLAPNDSGM